MPAAPSPLARHALASIVAAATLLALAGCVPAPGQPSLPTPTATSSDSPTAQPEPTATSGAQPLDIDCAELVDPDTMYAFDPNYALIGEVTPEPGSLAAENVAAGGVACQWVRESGGGTIDLAVAAFSDDEIAELKNEARAESQPVPTYGEEAYFEVEGGVGTAIVFQGRYRLIVSSVAFFEAGEPTGIVESALGAL